MPGLGFTSPFTVTPGTVTSVGASEQRRSRRPRRGSSTRGIHVTADQEITVYGLNRQQFTTDAYLGLPVDVLGSSNLVLGIGTGLGRHLRVRVRREPGHDHRDGHADRGRRGGRTAGTPYNVTLNKGEAYQLRALNRPAGPERDGRSNADKPIAVFGGHQCANIPIRELLRLRSRGRADAPDRHLGEDFLTRAAEDADRW